MAIIRRDPFREIERWEPFGEMESLHRRMNRLFERIMPSGTLTIFPDQKGVKASPDGEFTSSR